jgi:hypothetical protein
VLQSLDAHLKQLKHAGSVDLRVRADEKLPYEVVKRMTIELQRRASPSQIGKIFAEVGEKERP